MRSFYEDKSEPFFSEERADMDFPAHLHKQVEVLYIREGSVVVQIDGQEQALFPGDLAIAFPNAIHSYHTPVSSTTQLFIFDVDLTGDYAALFPAKQPQLPFLLAADLHPDAVHAMEELTAEGMKMDARLRKGYLQVLVGRILPLVQLREIRDSDRSDLVGRALRYLSLHYREPVTLEEVARHVGASPYYLSRLFSEKIGSCFKSYLNMQRVSYACGLLAQDALSLEEISDQAGFVSTRTFYRAFLEHCGMPPGEYKKQLIADKDAF